MTGNTDGLSATPSNWPNNPDRPVEKVSWEDIQKFLTRLNAQEAGNIPAGGPMYYPRKRSGSMPAVQARPRRIRGGIVLPRAMRITPIVDTHRHVMWAYTVPTLGAFLICTEMCGSGRRTGTQHTVREHRLILRVQRRAPTVSIGAAPGTIPARTCVRPTASASPPATVPPALASVSVSRKYREIPRLRIPIFTMRSPSGLMQRKMLRRSTAT